MWWQLIEPVDQGCPPSSLQTLMPLKEASKHQPWRLKEHLPGEAVSLVAWFEACLPCSSTGLESGHGLCSEVGQRRFLAPGIPWGWIPCSTPRTLLLFFLPLHSLIYMMSLAGGTGQVWLSPFLPHPVGEAGLQSIQSVLLLCG